MNWFYNLKISVKLIIGFVLVALIAGVVGFIGITNISKIDSNYTMLYKDFGIAVGDIGDVDTYYQQTRVAVRDTILDKNNADKAKHITKIKELDKSIDEALVKFEKSLKTDEGRRGFEAVKDAISKFHPVREKIITLSLANQEDQALVLLRNEGLPLANAIEESIDKMVGLKKKTGLEMSEDYSKVTDTTIFTMIAVITVAMIIAVILGVFISRIISKPVNELVEVADRIAKGDLDVRVEVKSKDEIGILSQSFDTMTNNINDVMSSINASAEQVAAGSRQVSASSQILSQGSTEQASSIEEITSSMSQVAAQTKQNALNADQANGLAAAARENAVQGNEQMKEMLKSMQEINESSANISKIIKVIDEIAFQTNILALNAAVEAARAGQHGKGFAVVAEEVRNLAARSANAAKETTAMIEGSISKVEAGTKIANETAAALNKIVDGVAKAAVFVADIATASNEQASGITQVNQAIAQVAQVVQTNSATAEESASASEELSSQADVLKDTVAKFKLKKTRSMSNISIDTLSPDVIRMIEDVVVKKKSNNVSGAKGAYAESACAASKSKITLDDGDFGKY